MRKESTGNCPAVGTNDFFGRVLQVCRIDTGSEFPKPARTDSAMDRYAVVISRNDNFTVLIR